MTKKINFQTLYRKFKSKVIRHFLLTAFWTVWNIVLFGAITELFKKETISSGYNYAEILIPKTIRKWNWVKGIKITSQWWFIVIGLSLVIGYALFYYLNYLWEEELRVKGGHYTQNLILDKFRRLTFEEKQAQKDKVSKLAESDTWEIGHYWEHLPNHIFHNGLKIIGLLLFYSGEIAEMSGQAIIFSLFWLGLINVIIYFFTKKILQNDEKYKKRLDKEWAVIDKERSNINLIENMGLTSEYRERQRKIKQDNKNLCLKFSRTKSLSKTIPNNLLIEFYPFLLLGLSGNSFNGKILIVFWWIFSELSSIFRCFWDYTDYSSSRSRINAFLALPEKNDNLKGISLNPQFSIKSIKFENVSFRYAGQKEWIIRHYTHTFSRGKLNSLRGKNGTGKSTKFYLLLGVIKPQEGKIIIELKNEQTYELHQDINLASWRADNVAYCAHETLVEEGSTGQKQLANISQILSNKKDCQVFLFDEADNALDEDNQKEFREKVKELAKNKLVIYIKH